MEHPQWHRRSLKGTCRVLVMEKEDVTRQFTQRTLSELGYSVSSAAGTSEAIGYYRLALESGQPYQAVILALETCDDVGGLEVFEQFRLMDPDVRVVVSSANPDDPVLADCRRFGFHSCLTKPFGEAELAAALEDRY